MNELVGLIGSMAVEEGYTAMDLPGLRLLRSSSNLDDVPVLYRPGAVFVLQGAKRGFLGDESFVYDAEHYLAVSVPVPFRMESRVTADAPLLAIYMDFDLSLAAELIDLLPDPIGHPPQSAKGLISSPMEKRLCGTLLRLAAVLADPIETVVLGRQLLRELHFRVLTGAQGGGLIAALRQAGGSGGIGRSLAYIRQNYRRMISVEKLASEAGMSVASFHNKFRGLTGITPLNYVKSLRLHEARLLMARDACPVAAAADLVGYASSSQFSREFKRFFGRTASEEAHWIRAHLGELGRSVTSSA